MSGSLTIPVTPPEELVGQAGRSAALFATGTVARKGIVPILEPARFDELRQVEGQLVTSDALQGAHGVLAHQGVRERRGGEQSESFLRAERAHRRALARTSRRC
ncbi:hypothetical protein HPB48_017832 [Haemaphysalis longicornis]|uniref:Uncharacterized protein n=1 Tax=Haemaphysalis longicornis TaxID=44386 RepID=A0A9J6GDP4_HAELO|nr:hypothetical protein HPB48_017832 [Haemaphysalis longicornis]